jgi:hypothetical protein
LNTKVSMIMSIVCGLIALIVIGAIYIWAPVCDQFIEMANGNMTHMKCFYTAHAATYLAILLLVSSIIGLVTKNSTAIISLIIGIMLITITNDAIGIGVCKKSTMSCIQTAVWLKGCGIITIIASAVQLFIKK